MTRWLREATLWLGAVAGVLALVGAVAVIGFGYSLLVFRSGSMSPEITTGSLAIARDVDASDIRTGDVVSVTSAEGTRITHRVVEVDHAGEVATLSLKGDANSDPDDEVYPVTQAPRVVASVPGMGYVVAQLLSPSGLFVAGAIGSVMVALGLRSDRDRGPRPPRAPRSSHGRRRALRTRRNALVAGTVASVALGTAVSGTMAFFTDAATATTSGSSAEYFSCTQALSTSKLAPWAWFEFDESDNATTTMTNSVSGGVTAAFSATPPNRTTTRACARDSGKSGTFNGSTTAASTASVLNSNGSSGSRWNTFTISVWFRTTSTTSMGNLISMGNAQTGVSGSHDRHLILRADGRLAFGVYPGSVQEVTTPTGVDYSDNAWHMATATLSSAGMRLYVDGDLKASRNDITTAEQMSNMFWRFGYDTTVNWGGSPSNSYFTGRMDEIAIWTRALSATEVYDLFRAA